jgi:outer membrane protein assembly factor BamB
VIRRFALVLLLALLGGCSTLSNWTEGLFGGEDNSPAPAQLKPVASPVKLDRIWSTSVGDGNEGQVVRLVPTVVDDVLYVADRKGRVEALDAATGKQLWTTRLKAAISAGPGAGAGLVLLGTSEARVIALDASSGKQRWTATVSSEVLSVPQLDLDRVIVQTADGTITGLDAQDGHQLWVSDRTVPVLTLRGTSTPAVTHGIVLAGFATGKLVAFSADKGFIAWEKAIAIPKGRSELERIVDIDGDPVVAGSAVFVVTYQGRIARVDIQNGNVEWARDMSSSVGLGVDYSQVYVTDDKSDVWALSRSTGASEWKLDALANRGLTAPGVFGDYVVVGDAEGYVHLLSRADGHVAGRIEVDGRGIRARPVAVNGVLYIYGNSGKLAAYRLHGG